MIHTTQQLKDCLQADKSLYPKLGGGKCLKNRLVTSTINTQYNILQYIYLLRKAEYHYNNSFFSGHKSWYHTFICVYYFYQLRQNSYKTGFQIAPNTCGPGLQIWHYGYIIVNQNARIGANATLYPGVVNWAQGAWAGLSSYRR